MKEEEVLEGIIYPPISRFYNSNLIFLFVLYAMPSILIRPTCRIRDITKEVAAAVVREAVAEDLSEGYRDMDAHELARLSEVVNLYISQANYVIVLLWPSFFNLEVMVMQEETIEYVKTNMWSPLYPTIIYKD